MSGFPDEPYSTENYLAIRRWRARDLHWIRFDTRQTDRQMGGRTEGRPTMYGYS